MMIIIQRIKKIILFSLRRIYYQKIRQKFDFQHQPKPLKNIKILSSKFFAKTDFSKFKDTTADKILAGNLSIYSLTKLKVGKKINWHKDYLSGFEWPKDIFYQDIKYDYPKGTDIKNPWEISRFQQMLTMGAAFRKTKAKGFSFGENGKYAQYFVNQVSDWIEQNPVYYGINWKCTMEVAIRACNWLLAYDLFRNSRLLNKRSEFYQLFLGSLSEHGEYIFQNLENIGIKTNHYMANLVGLIWLGLLCPDLPNAKKWLRFGLKELEKEVSHQFYEDGVNFEASTSYHRLSLELVAYTVILCHNHKIKFSPQFYKRLKKAFKFTAYYIKPNGEAVQFGDNDSGRLFIFADYFIWESLDHRYLVNSAHYIFPKNKLFYSQKLQPECWWMNLKIAQKPLKNYTKYFPKGQILITNKWDWYMAIIAGSVGQDGNGGHAHNDTGSFELNYKGEDFIIDPGTYLYLANPKLRNEFRSINSHSVFAIQNQEFNPFVPDLFRLKAGPKPKVKIERKRAKILFKIEYLNKSLERVFNIGQNNVKIIDTEKIKTKHELIQNLILDSQVKARINQNQTIIKSNKNQLFIKMINPKIKSIQISKAYRKKIPSSKIFNQLKAEGQNKRIEICQTKK